MCAEGALIAKRTLPGFAVYKDGSGDHRSTAKKLIKNVVQKFDPNATFGGFSVATFGLLPHGWLKVLARRIASMIAGALTAIPSAEAIAFFP